MASPAPWPTGQCVARAPRPIDLSAERPAAVVPKLRYVTGSNAISYAISSPFSGPRVSVASEERLETRDPPVTISVHLLP